MHSPNQDTLSRIDDQNSSSTFNCKQTHAQNHDAKNGAFLSSKWRDDLEPREKQGPASPSLSRMFVSNLTALAFTANITNIDVSISTDKKIPVVCLEACLKANSKLRQLRLGAECKLGPQFADYFPHRLLQKINSWCKEFYKEVNCVGMGCVLGLPVCVSVSQLLSPSFGVSSYVFPLLQACLSLTSLPDAFDSLCFAHLSLSLSQMTILLHCSISPVVWKNHLMFKFGHFRVLMDLI